MSFLEEYDQVPAANPQMQAGVIFKWLKSDWRTMCNELRAARPVFRTPAFTMLTRWTEISQTLTQPEVFSVRPNRRSMDPSVGPFMLARDGARQNWHDKSVMRCLLRPDDLPAVRQLVEAEAVLSLSKCRNAVEVVSQLGRLMPLRVVQKYFGFPGPDDATMLRWSRATQMDMFRNPTIDASIQEANYAAGAEMRAYLGGFLSERRKSLKNAPDDVVSRLLRLEATGLAAMTADEIIANVCGLLVGAIETSSQAIVQALEQLLMRPTVATQAKSEALKPSAEMFDRIVWEALRFNPITPLVFRICEREVVVVGETLAAGTVLACCIGSAMFDEALFPEPESFRTNRPQDSYLHLGFGPHECLGIFVGKMIVPETLRQVFRLRRLRLASGNDSGIDYEGGPFPERFVVDFDAMSERQQT